MSTWGAQLALIALCVLALRLPFLNQAIQGDDIYYLYGAEHAQIDPAHPNHARYIFLGETVDMRGHPHPPLDAWFLAALLAGGGDVKEVPFHAAYILFSLIAAVSALALARRFSPRPLAATLLFLVTPPFVINGNSFEADLPFLAFWLASIALFVPAVDRRSLPVLAASCAAMALAAMTAYQAIILVPILFLYGRRWRPACAAALTPAIVVGVWQLYERLSTGALPATVLAGYMQTYGLQQFAQKLKNAAALTAHLGWIIFPVLTFAAFRRRWMILAPLTAAAIFIDRNPLFWLSVSAGLALLLFAAGEWRDFIAQWILIFFAGALIVFFAGSARYLLPIALPVAIFAARRLSPRWIYAGIAAGALVSLTFAVVNYQHWNGYRQFASTLAAEASSKRVWINAEWGLRYYLESEGALPLATDQAVRPGDIIVSSRLAYPLKYTTGGGFVAPLAERAITSRIPLRLSGLTAQSAYSTTAFGLRPFDISTGPIDRVTAGTVIARAPTLEFLPMNSPEAARQIVTGIYDVEDGPWRWMSGKGIVLLKSPTEPLPVRVQLYIPDHAPARTIKLFLDGDPISHTSYSKPGAYTMTTAAIRPSGPTTTLTIEADKTFSVPGDHRELGIVLSGVGFSR